MGKVIFQKDGKYSGWLGNCMFQVASTIGIAIKNDMQYAFPPKDYYNAFQGEIPQESGLHGAVALDYQENNFHYNEVKLNPDLNYNLLGYFQSEKYFKHCAGLIRQIFNFKDEVIEAVKNKYSSFFIAGTLEHKIEFVAVHVRRGDYLKYPDVHPALPMEYYLKCAIELQKLRPDVKFRFAIFSDDIPWCKENLKCLQEFGQVLHIEGNSEVFDMCFRSVCHHHIMANSTASWWSSYLCRFGLKIIFAPKKEVWFGRERIWNVDDLYQDNWILI